MTKSIWPADLLEFFPEARNQYPDNAVRKFCLRFEIPDEKLQQFLNKLALAGRDYINYSEVIENRQIKKEALAKLRSLTSAAERLEAKLAEAMSEFHMPLYNAWMHHVHQIHDGEDAPFRQIGAATPIENDAEKGFNLIDYEDALAGVRMLALCAQKAPEYLKEGRKGRPSHWHIDHWVRLHCDFWHEDLGRKVTLDRHKGELTSPVGIFLTELMRQLDSDAIKYLPQALEKYQHRPKRTSEK
ncbi:hypothetical protein [Minwuia sp.]|uniref:hypothetical protein n=1 Tax=Minwuia sp. TaxID=2493630 RepID=UPI003A8FAA45